MAPFVSRETRTPTRFGGAIVGRTTVYVPRGEPLQEGDQEAQPTERQRAWLEEHHPEELEAHSPPAGDDGALSSAEVTPDAFVALKAGEAVELVKATEDLDAVRAWAEAESALAKPRATVVAALEAKLSPA